MADILDWTGADLEKLDMDSFEARADEMAERLRVEPRRGVCRF